MHKTLFKSDFYKIIKINDVKSSIKKLDSSIIDSFNISFIQKGNFLFKKGNKNFDNYTSYAIIDKPNEIQNREYYYQNSEECIIISFNKCFYKSITEEKCTQYKSFLNNNDLQTKHIKTEAEVELLFHLILQLTSDEKTTQFRIDSLILDLLDWFLEKLNVNDSCEKLNSKFKEHHLETIQKSKSFIINNFKDEINLLDIASHANLSLFHFSRIFKKLTGNSPYQFLMDTRLKHAEVLIRNSNLSIKDILYESGFSSPEYFSSSFKQKYGTAPSLLKAKMKE